MNNKMTFAQGAVGLLQHPEHIKNYVGVLNLSLSEFELVTGDNVWARSEMDSVKTTLSKLVYGSAEIHGMSNEAFTAEWVAMMIVTFVKPLNWFPATLMFSNLSYSMDVITSAEQGIRQFERNVSHARLQALCHLFIGNTDIAVFEKLQNSVMQKITGKPTK